MQKILFLSEHEASELHNSNTESLDHLPFFPKNSWSGGIQDLFHKSKIGDTDTFKFVIFAFGNNMSPYLLLNFLFIKYRKSPGKIPKRILKIQWTFHSIPEKKHLQYYFDVTQSNISLKPLVHINISRPLPLFLFLQEPSTITKRFLKSIPMKISMTWTSVTSSTTHHLPQHPLLRRNSRKNGKLYERSSQSSQITPGILQ